MTERIQRGELLVDASLHEFVNAELLPAIGRDPDVFWAGLERIVAAFMPRNRQLLAVRARLQEQLDEWYRTHPVPFDAGEYEAFLRAIGYLLPEPAPFHITTTNVDPEIATIAGPQLVVPVRNARFALNAVNARWGSLYDALYGTDAIGGHGGATRGGYDAGRGAHVIAYSRGFLDEATTLAKGSHAAATAYEIVEGELAVTLADGTSTGLAEPAQLRGYRGPAGRPSAILLLHHGLHIEIVIDPRSRVGTSDRAGVSDIVLEAAITAIVDFEDSIAAVDADEKVDAYRTWLGLNIGDLATPVTKDGITFIRRLADDRSYTGPDGSHVELPGRAVVYVRNVGHLMTTDAVVTRDGTEIGEGILDAVLTAAAALAGVDPANPRPTNRTGSVYIVKPKMHGPDEVAFTVDLFAAVEDLLELPRNSIKLGLMDEERRLSVNLAASIERAKERIVFINTGFLDRSGDEIHTSMVAGPVVRKADLKTECWIGAYEDQNVDIGLAAGFAGRAQIGKGMWAMPDLMADMLAAKIEQPRAGASTAWVPSPSAATLHALHYHQVDVDARQAQLAQRRRRPLADLLTLAIGEPSMWGPAERQQEVDNNVQSLLGYVVRWVDQGIGCSKVPDIHNVALMEDRATLRISSQLLANWVRHGVVSEDQVRHSLHRMAGVVDRQNAGDPAYRPMAADPTASVAFRAAEELIFEGTRQPSGYTEPILHRRRREFKRSQVSEAGRPAASQ